MKEAEFYVGGVKFRKGWQEMLINLEKGQKLTLLRDPSNRFDRKEDDSESNAVVIGSEIAGTIGYVPAKQGLSKEISQLLKEGFTLEATIEDLNIAEPWRSVYVKIVNKGK